MEPFPDLCFDTVLSLLAQTLYSDIQSAVRPHTDSQSVELSAAGIKVETDLEDDPEIWKSPRAKLPVSQPRLPILMPVQYF